MSEYKRTKKLSRKIKEIGGLKTYSESERALNATLKTIKTLLLNKEEVYLKGIGSLSIIKRKATTGYSVQKQKAIEVPETYLISFKRSKAFMKELKNKKNL